MYIKRTGCYLVGDGERSKFMLLERALNEVAFVRGEGTIATHLTLFQKGTLRNLISVSRAFACSR